MNEPVESGELTVTVILPCLNEEETVAACVASALAALKGANLAGEVVVADNGSTDRSAELARAAGARVVDAPERGYGNAYLAGFAAAKGKYLVLADADETYDLSLIPVFVEKLEAGAEMVMGSRFRGVIADGAMPWSHRYIGNPVLTGILTLLFGVEVSDAHCGMRALRRDVLPRLDLRTGGMEFASEMVIKAGKADLIIDEVPIDYGVRGGESKLRTVRDGWRHLRFMLLLSPTATLLVPGLLLSLVGLAGTVALRGGPIWIGKTSFDVHIMVLLSAVALLGAQVLTLGVSARSYALLSGFESKDALIEALHRHFTLERGLVLGALLFGGGFAIDASIAWDWARAGFPALDRVRDAILGTLLMALGAQVIAGTAFLSMLRISRASDPSEGN